MKFKFSIFTSLVLLSTINANEVVELENILVSTTSLGAETKVEDVQASVQVIDKKVIDDSKSRSLPQLLSKSLGVEIKDAGSTSSVSIRGFDDSHTLILVDGLRRTGKYGSTDLTAIQVEDIERIEIVRGPMSTLYGADAIAGVVNIITNKKASNDYTKLTFLAGIAQNHERETFITKLSGKKTVENIIHNYAIELREKEDYRFDKSQVDTDLKNESRKFLNYGNTIEIDDSKKLTTKLEYSRQDDDGLNSSSYKTYEKENRYQLATNFNYVQDDFIYDGNLGYGYSDTKVDRGTGLETTDYRQLEFNNYFRHFTTDDMINIFGLGYKNDDIDVSMYTKSAKRDNVFALIQNEYDLTDTITTNIGVRYDNFSDFGSTLNPKLSIMYKKDGLSLRSSYGEAFKAPSFTNMYSHFTRSRGPYISDISGSENLKPEESKTYELALSYNTKNLDFEIIHHRSKLDNLISSYVSGTSGFTTYYSYKNINKSKINGTEASLSYDFKNGLIINSGVEYLDTKDETTGERLTGSAKISYKLNLSYEYNNLTTFLNIKRLNDYYAANESRTNINSDYTLVDVKANYKFNKNIEFFMGVDNLQDKQMPYNMTSRGTPNDPGERFYYTGMTYTF